MILPALYHWSPTARRMSILKEGLTLYADSPSGEAGELKVGWPHICLGFDPSRAWALSGDMGWIGEEETWDLWQVQIADSDEVHLLPDYGPNLKEVRIKNSIPADRVRYVATRDILVAVCKHGGTTREECDQCFPEM